MSDIEKIVAAMPKALYVVVSWSLPIPFSDIEMKKWNATTKAQCQLLAKLGYRPVPSKGQIFGIVRPQLDVIEARARALEPPAPHHAYILANKITAELHRWLLEGE